MAEVTEALPVYADSPPQRKEIGSVVLNGYLIDNESPLGFPQGTMRSFRVVRGDFWDSWNEQRPLAICAANGDIARIRIAALPVDNDSYGLVEFL